MRLILIILLSPILGFSQQTIDEDSLNIEQNRASILSIALPVTLFTTGAILSSTTTEKSIQTKVRNFVGNDFRTHVDDYLQFSPIALMYGVDLLNVKSRNTPYNQTKFLGMSTVLAEAITLSLKYTVKKMRPDSSARNSFPSGHTTFAFATATVFYQEFKNSNKVLAFSPYLISTAVGALRVANNRHWTSDVLAGAGVGILATNIIYYFEPLKNWTPFPKYLKVSSTDSRLIQLSYRF